MRTSTDRILTTHTGSLPRPDDLTRLMYDHQDGKPVDAELEERVTSAVDEIVARQVEAGVDVVSDGEMGKPGFLNYVSERLTGFGGEADPWSFVDLTEAAPELAEEQYQSEAAQHIHPPRNLEAITYVGEEQTARDIANLKAALEAHPVTEAFLPAASPGLITQHFPTDHYSSYEEYLFACADAMRPEYEAIVGAGIVLQLDCPDIPTSWPDHGRYSCTAEVERLGYRKFLELHVAALNHAIEGLPVDMLRMHLCWGNYVGPHHHDVPLDEVLPPVFGANVRGISFEAANPRHEHEWEVFREIDLPDDKVIIPGVIDTLTSFVEHPRVVAQRLERFASVVGRERVMGGTDCGFGTFVGFGAVTAGLTWRKLASLAQGAELASQSLWKRAA